MMQITIQKSKTYLLSSSHVQFYSLLLMCCPFFFPGSTFKYSAHDNCTPLGYYAVHNPKERSSKRKPEITHTLHIFYQQFLKFVEALYRTLSITTFLNIKLFVTGNYILVYILNSRDSENFPFHTLTSFTLNSSSSTSQQTISFAVQEKRSSSLFCHQTGMLELELHLEGKILKHKLKQWYLLQ